MMIAAALASLPPGMLDALMTQAGRSQGNTSGRSGQFKTGSQRGRPLPPGQVGPAAILDCMCWPPCAQQRLNKN